MVKCRRHLEHVPEVLARACLPRVRIDVLQVVEFCRLSESEREHRDRAHLPRVDVLVEFLCALKRALHVHNGACLPRIEGVG